MKKLLTTFTVLALTAGSALAADLPSRKAAPVIPPPPPPPPMWTGFYVGLNAGAAWTNSNQQTIGVGPVAIGNYFSKNEYANDVAAFATAASASGFNSGNNVGFIGGGQMGYNWQFYNSLVAGVEADIQGIAGNNGSRTVWTAVPGGSYKDYSSNNWFGITSVRGSLDYLGTVRGRLGWLFTPTLLLYGTGGLAYGGVTINTATQVYNDGYFSNYISPSFGGVNFSNTQVGWTAGGGLEWMFWPNWSAKVEYLYYDLGSVNQGFAMPVTYNYGEGYSDASLFAGQVRARINGNIVRAGLNYHFNWGAPAPVVAKY
jgi:outer membrane immunogenic protein